MKAKRINLILALIAAIIMLQTLFYKFSANPESVYIFSTLGIEPWGRIATGIAELVAGILLLISRTRLLGALMGTGIMSGAIASHLFILGFRIMNDGGLLFALALITFICCTLLLFLNRDQIRSTLKTS